MEDAMTSASRTGASTATLRRRGALLAGCALWIAVSASAAHAQAFNSSPIVRGGSVTFNRTPGNDLITVETNTAVIDWVRPLNPGNPLIFLPAGNVATFQNGPNNANFAVLNRIFSTVPVRFDGTVLSQLRSAAGTASTGGIVLFASPAGIIVGPTALFDVGSLVLTTLDIANDLAQEGPGNFIDPTGAIDFSGGSASPDAAVVTLPGSQIRALNEGSFVTMVAPRLLVGGSVRVNGSAAYVAAEAALVRFNAGLFDIVVNAGSDNPNPIIHTGSTGGPASTGAGDNHRIYMVTAARTQAINALLGGTIGFDDATSATVENGAIILSSGFNVYGDTVDRYGAQPAGVPARDIASSFQITDGTLTSDLFGFAQTDALAGGTSSLLFRGDVSLFGGNRAQLYAGVGGTTTVQGNALISAARFDSVDDVSALTGGDARMFALAGGTLTILGDAIVDASARGQVNSDGFAGSGTGGTALVSADGGTIRVGGALRVRATGEGPAGFSSSPLDPVDGVGGNAAVEALNGGQLVATGDMRIDASGIGGGFGRSAGIGGTSRLSVASGGSVTGTSATLVATGIGGNNGAGAGQGGTVLLTASAGNVVLTGAADLDASGRGGSAAGPGAAGADGRGGTAQVRASNGAAASRIATGSLRVDVRGTGGAGGPGGAISGVPGPGGAGGNGFGGSATAYAESGNGTLDTGAVTILAHGIGGAGGTGAVGGGGTGGTIAAGTIAGSVAAGSAGTARFGTLDFNASGLGGTGGGAGRGGSVTLAASGGQVIQTGGAQLLADGNAGGTGALALGGLVTTGADSGGTLTAGNVTGRVNSVGGGAGSTAGRWRVYANGGNATYANLTLGASGGLLLPATSLIEPTNGTINVLGVAALSSQGSIALNAAGSGRLIGGAIGLTAGDDVLFTHASPTAATIDAASLTVLAGDDFNAAAGVVTRTSARTEIRATDQASIAGQIGGRDILVTGSGIDIAAGGSVGDATSLTTTLQAVRTAQVFGNVRGGAVLVTATDILLAAGGGIGDGATTQTRLQASNLASLSGQVLGADILVQGARINVATTGIVGGASTGPSELRATGAVDIAGLMLGRNILVTGSGVTLATTGAIGNATSVGVIVRTPGLASLSGGVRGADILIDAGQINVTATGSVGSAATIRDELRATGAIDVAGSVLGRAIVIGAAGVNLAATGTIGASSSTASVGIDATNSIFVAGAIRGTDIRAAAPSINVAAGGSVGDGSSTLVRLLAGNNATVAGQVLGADIRVQGGTILVSGAVGDAASRNVIVSATGNATVSGSVLGNAISVTGAQAIVTATGVVGGPQTATTQVRAIGDASVAGRVLGTNIVVGGTNVILAAGGAIGGIGTDAVSLLAVDDANIAGAVRGRNITIGSADIDIAATGTVGDANTELVLLAVNGGNPTTSTASLDTSAILAPNQFTVLGGTTEGPGYTLGNAEAGRIRAGTLRVVAPTLSAAANRAPDLLIRDLAFNGGGAAAGIGRFELVTAGIVRVEGALSMAGARPTDGMALDAGQRLEVATTTGSIRVRDAAGAPAGSLTLTSANLWVASAGLIDRLRADPFYAGRDQDLFGNGGTETPRGFVEANAVTLATGGTLFVQNSGNFLQFGGVTTGPPGLLIRSTVPGANVTAFGRRRNADGSFSSGQLLFFETGFAAPGNGPRSAGFTAESTFNTCRIVSGLCPGARPDSVAPGRDPTTGPTGGSDLVQLPPGVPNDDLVDTSFSAEGLIEEPVTSGGESLLWAEPCEPDENGRCDEVQP
jgi:filamentous hemagglutinin family protein